MQPTVFEFVEPTGNMLGKVFLHDYHADNKFKPPHWHNCLEFDGPFVGCLECASEGMIHTAQVGDFVFINDNVIHATRGVDVIHYRGFTLLLPMAVINRYLSLAEPYYFDFEGKPEIKKLVWEELMGIARLVAEQPPGYEPMADSRILRIASLLVAHCLRIKKKESMISPASRQMTKDILEYLQYNYHSPLTLELVADHYGFSRTYFSKYFKKHIGINFYECLKRFRLSQAYYEVMHTDRTITDIALRCGFPNVKSFIATFKEIYLETPQSYRSGHRAESYDSPSAPVSIWDMPSVNAK